MQEALTAKTFARAEEAGYNDGYTLILVKWMYQVMRGTSVDKSTVFDLCSTEQYREMRQKMEREGVGVLVWHVSQAFNWLYRFGC